MKRTIHSFPPRTFDFFFSLPNRQLSSPNLPTKEEEYKKNFFFWSAAARNKRMVTSSGGL